MYATQNGDHLMKEFIVFCLVTLICPGSLPATESHSVELKAPGVSVERTDTYPNGKAGFDNAVKEKERNLQEQGGAAMVNEAQQPIREVTLRAEAGIAILGVGVSVSKEHKATQSAAEQGLKNHEKKKNKKGTSCPTRTVSNTVRVLL